MKQSQKKFLFLFCGISIVIMMFLPREYVEYIKAFLCVGIFIVVFASILAILSFS
jgi:hypothetical protein